MQDQQARKRGGPFALVNGATAREVLCLAVPAGLSVDVPVHILHISTGIWDISQGCHIVSRFKRACHYAKAHLSSKYETLTQTPSFTVALLQKGLLRYSGSISSN